MRRSTTSNDGWFWANLRIYTPFRALAVGITAATLTVGCGREAGMARTVGTLNYSLPSEEKSKKRVVSHAEVAAESALEVGALLHRQSKAALTSRQQERLAAGMRDLDGRLALLQRQFVDDREKLSDFGADAALARLARVERRTGELKADLHRVVEALPADGARSRDAARGVKVLSELFPAEPEQATSSDLSFGIKNADPKTAPTSAGITPAYAAPTSNTAASPLPPTPAAEDLLATADTRITPKLELLAEQLAHDPVKLYRYVHDNIGFEPYAGIRKSPEQTLEQRTGSDAEQAALLVALLRESGVHARFVRGVAELPADKLANLLSIDVASGQRVAAGPDILASGGIPTTQIRVDGELSRVRFDHVWLEAYLPAKAYRGVDEGQSAKTWMPLDPSITAVRVSSPTTNVDEDLAEEIKPKVEQYFDQMQQLPLGGIKFPNGAETRAFANGVRTATADVLDDRGVLPGVDRKKLFSEDAIVPHSAPYLPSTLPFKTLTVMSETRSVPQALWSRIDIDVGGALASRLPAFSPERDSDDGFSFSASTFELADKRLTVSYAPATPQDAEIIDSYHGLLDTPSYAASLIPVLRADGQIVARGERPAPVGYWQNFRIAYRSPGFTSDVVENPLAVGTMAAISLNASRKARTQVDARIDRLAEVTHDSTQANVLTDRRIGELLALFGDMYFALNDNQNRSLADAYGVDARRGLSGAIVSTKLRTVTVAGFPVSSSLSGFNIDVDQDVQAVTPLTSTPGLSDSYLTSSATSASLSESLTFSLVFGTRAASTTGLLARAATAGIPIYEVTSANVDAVAPVLTQSAAVVSQVREAVADGASVVIPRDPVTSHVWTGTGYIVKNGTSMAFQISGGTSGGDVGPGFFPFPSTQFNPNYSVTDPNYDWDRKIDLSGLAAWAVFRIAEMAGLPNGFTACIESILWVVEKKVIPTDGKALALKIMQLSSGLAGWAAWLLEIVIAVNEAIQTAGSMAGCAEAIGQSAAWFFYGDG